MKAVLTCFFALLGAAAIGAPAERPPLAHTMLGVANGCFVETVAFLDRWHEANGAGAWARLLQWGAREEDEIVAGHAVGVCEARGVLWSWDVNHGWTRLDVPLAQREDAGQVAAPILKKYPRVTARYPTFRFDFPQTLAAALSTRRPVATTPALRDATLVGERLARRRPVNVVRFDYGSAGEKRESAAVVFVFHGRYCVYVPELGTVPFRVRTGVENIRIIQDLLRRMLPGVTGVRKL